MSLTDLAGQFSTGSKHRYRVHDDNSDTTTDQLQRDFAGFLTASRLSEQQLGHIDADGFGIMGVQSVLYVNVGRRKPFLLSIGNDMECQRGLGNALRPKHFGLLAPRQTAYP